MNPASCRLQWLRCCAIPALLAVGCAAGAADSNWASGGDTESRIEWLQDELSEHKGTESLVPEMPPPGSLGPESRAALEAAYTAYYEYQEQGFAHRRNVFIWQLVSSVVIFVVVILLMMAGVYFSWIQFQQGLNENEQGADQDMTTNLEVSGSGFKISSPILGVIILVISLGFFYLYLVHVYPIREIL